MGGASRPGRLQSPRPDTPSPTLIGPVQIPRSPVAVFVEDAVAPQIFTTHWDLFSETERPEGDTGASGDTRSLLRGIPFS